MEQYNFFKFNKDQQIDYSTFSIKIDKDNIADENVRKLFSIFDTEKEDGTAGKDGILSGKELTNLWEKVREYATKNHADTNADNENTLDRDEAAMLLNEQITNGIGPLQAKGLSVDDIFNALNFIKVMSPKTIDNYFPTISLTEEAAQENVISILSEDLANANTLLMQQNNGIVSDAYDRYKEWADDDLSLSNLEEMIQIQSIGIKNLYGAKEGILSKREYFVQNREHLKIMMKRRLFRKNESTGLNFIDLHHGKMTKEKFAQLMEDYINAQIDKIDKLDSLRQLQQSLLLATEGDVETLLNAYKKELEQEILYDVANEKPVIKTKTPAIPVEYDTTEPMTFEEVFKLERNREYSKDNIEKYLQQKQKTDLAVGAFNKYQAFKTAGEQYLNDYNRCNSANNHGVEINLANQIKKVIELFTSYYENPFNPNRAFEELSRLISENNLPIKISQNNDGEISLDLSQLPDSQTQNETLNKLVKLEMTSLQTNLETLLGGNIEDKMLELSQNTQTYYSSAYGGDFANELVQKMVDGNIVTKIQEHAGNASMVGMALTVVGGILCFTPVAPLGGGMVTLGNTMAIGGMATNHIVGLTEALTRENWDEEEIKELSKSLVMDAGGFVVGFAAGKVGMKLFNKLIDKKLAAVFKTEMMQGNRAEALKKVFTNPEYLANFMKAAGVKFGTDFGISLFGDLIMMGVLDTNDDLFSLFKSNLMGTLVGMSSDLKDVGFLSRYSSLKQKELSGTATQAEIDELVRLREGYVKDGIDVDAVDRQIKDEMNQPTTVKQKASFGLDAPKQKNNVTINEIYFDKTTSKAICNMKINGKEISFPVAYILKDSQRPTLQRIFESADNLDELLEINNILLSSKFLNTRDYVNQLERICEFKRNNPNTDIKFILENLKEGITDIGKEHFDALNKMFYGAEPTELKVIREEFKTKHGVDLKFDNNITPEMAKKYSVSVEKMLARYKEAGKEAPTEILITTFVPNGSAGVAHAHKYPGLVCVAPNEFNIERFEHCLFHESVHLTDMINKRRDLQYKPIGTRLGIVNGEVKPVYNEVEAKNLKELISKYVSNYATADTNEFTAEFGAMLLENKIVIKEIMLDDGSISFDIHIEEPFINLVGKQIEVTDALRSDIEKIINYYLEIGGQNYPTSVENTKVKTRADERVATGSKSSSNTNTSALNEITSYLDGIVRDGDNYKPVFENPNSAFAQYVKYVETLNAQRASAPLKSKPKSITMTGFRDYIFDNADKLNISKEEYWQIVDKIAQDVKINAQNHPQGLRQEFIDNADKIQKWAEIFRTQDFDKVNKQNVYNKFYDEKMFNQAVKEYAEFVEQVTGKKVLIGCPSRMNFPINALGLFNNIEAYKDVDYIIFGHGKGSSLITDTTNPDTWRFADNNESIWEFIENNVPKDKKVLVICCETDGLGKAGKTSDEMVDRQGQKMSGIGYPVSGFFNHEGPAKICQSGTRHIVGQVSTKRGYAKTASIGSTPIMNSPTQLLPMRIVQEPSVIYYDLDYTPYKVENIEVKSDR